MSAHIPSGKQTSEVQNSAPFVLPLPLEIIIFKVESGRGLDPIWKARFLHCLEIERYPFAFMGEQRRCSRDQCQHLLFQLWRSSGWLGTQQKPTSVSFPSKAGCGTGGKGRFLISSRSFPYLTTVPYSSCCSDLPTH